MRSALERVAALAGDLPAQRRIADALARGAFADALAMTRTLSATPDRRSEKVISMQYKFVCVCIPKAGSRSLLTALQNAVADAEVFSLRTDELFALRPEAKRFFSFALLRHPFARSLSLYQELFFSEAVYAADYDAHRRQTGTLARDARSGETFRLRAPASELAQPARKEEKRRRMMRRCYGLQDVRSFDDYCDWLGTPFGADAHADRHYLSQHAHLRMDSGRLPDFIGRLETAAADLGRVAEHLGLPEPTLPMLNTMAGWHVAPAKLVEAQAAAQTRLTERNKALLRARYAEDFALGAYCAP